MDAIQLEIWEGAPRLIKVDKPLEPTQEEIQAAFLCGLSELEAEGKWLSPSKQSPYYGPKLIAAQDQRYTVTQLEAAMSALLKGATLKIIEWKLPNRTLTNRIVLSAEAHEEPGAAEAEGEAGPGEAMKMETQPQPQREGDTDTEGEIDPEADPPAE